MSSLGKKNDGRHGLRVQLVGNGDERTGRKFWDALSALGDPVKLNINERGK